MVARPRAMVSVKLIACVCQRCGHHWLPRDPDHKPIRCPFCSSINWDQPYKYKTYGGKEHQLRVLSQQDQTEEE